MLLFQKLFTIQLIQTRWGLRSLESQLQGTGLSQFVKPSPDFLLAPQPEGGQPT